jgi:hypothetical protein
VRCGDCADKCHFFIGYGVPRTCVLRAVLMRSFYRGEFTLGAEPGQLTGARVMEEDVLKEWFSTSTSARGRRCSLYCPTA